MIEPVLRDEALRADIRDADPGDGLAVWWLGQSGFLLKSAAGCLLFDPYLSDSLTAKYAATDKPHVRMTACPIAPARLDCAQLITSSHRHTDHLDAETLVPLLRANPGAALVVPEANRAFAAERLGCDPERLVGLDAGQTLQLGGFTITGVPSAHEQVDRDERGRCLYLGYVVRCGQHAVYHSGDTLWHEDLAAQLTPFQLDLALLPINGRLPTRRVAGNLWGQEAAALAAACGARLVVPCHFEMFTFNTETPAAFVAKCRELGQAYRLLRCGERFVLRDTPNAARRTEQEHHANAVDE